MDLDANIDFLALLEQTAASCKVPVGCEGQQQQQSMNLQLSGQYDGEYDGDSDNELTIDVGFNVGSPNSVSSVSTNTSDISDCDGLSPRSGRNQGDSFSSQGFVSLPLSKQ